MFGWYWLIRYGLISNIINLKHLQKTIAKGPSTLKIGLLCCSSKGLSIGSSYGLLPERLCCYYPLFAKFFYSNAWNCIFSRIYISAFHKIFCIFLCDKANYCPMYLLPLVLRFHGQTCIDFNMDNSLSQQNFCIIPP